MEKKTGTQGNNEDLKQGDSSHNTNYGDVSKNIGQTLTCESTDRQRYKRITSEISKGPRGEYYVYAEIWDGKIIALGEEQGNYVGGIAATCKEKKLMSSYLDRYKECYEKFLKTGEDSSESQLYEKIKDLEVAEELPNSSEAKLWRL